MLQVITLTGFRYSGLSADPTLIGSAELQIQATDDLEVRVDALVGTTDGSGTLRVTQGEVFGTVLSGLIPNLTDDQWSVKLAEATSGGTTGEVLVLETSDLNQGFVFELSGGPLTTQPVPTQEEIEDVLDGLTGIDSGPFALGTAFDPGAASSAEVNDDPLAGSPEADEINGFPINDIIDGEGGNDTINGSFGNDTILGGTGNDFISGDGGNDDINSGPVDGDFGGDSVTLGGGLNIVRGTPAEFNRDTINQMDFGDLLIIEGVNPSAFSEGPGANEYIIETTGDDTPEAVFTANPVFAAFEAGLVASALDGDTVLQLDPALAPEAGIGTGITGPQNFPDIADFLFTEGGITPIDIYYVGAIEGLALLDDGYAINEISGEVPSEVVGIDRGVFLSSGGGPGEGNTVPNFTVGLNEPGDPRLTETAQDAFPEAGDTQDASLITFTFDAENLGEQSSVSFDIFFGSDEFPEFVNSNFVDIAAIYVNGVNYALFNNDAEQPLSIVGTSINTPGNFYDNNGDDGTDANPFTGTFDTEYDGFSVLLNVIAPVQPGVNTVTIGVADTGDAAFDSGIFVGNIQGSDFDVGGSFVQTDGTSGDDQIDANGAPQLITLGGGEDTVTGTPQELNGDVIEGFGNDDTLAFEGVAFDADDLTVTMGSAILDVDTDGDGEDDTNVVLQGDFEDAVFALETVDGNTNITASGVNIEEEPGVLLEGDEGNDTFVGTAGPDTIIGAAGDDELDGADGDDGIFGQGDNDLLQGGGGNDEMAGGSGDDTIDGEGGNDNIGGGSGNDEIMGGLGNDTIGAGQGDDTALGGDGDDIVNGGGGDDSLVGEDGNDTMGASFNNDQVIGGLGDDDMGGGLGQDTIIGGGGNDRAGGGEGDDSINGGGGNDFLAGGGRNDVINGGAGDDTINGGDGDDTMSGGAGEDVFVFLRFNETDADIITDFEDGFDSFVMNDVENAPGTGLQGRLDALNITDVEGGAQITYQGHTVLIQGATAAQLTLDDFDFV